MTWAKAVVLVAALAIPRSAARGEATSAAQVGEPWVERMVRITTCSIRAREGGVRIGFVALVQHGDRVVELGTDLAWSETFAVDLERVFGASAPLAERALAEAFDRIEEDAPASVRAAAERERPRLHERLAYAVNAGVVLDRAPEEAIRAIAEQLLERTGHRLTVTSGSRTPAGQAEAMIDKLRAGDDLVRLYKDKDSAKAIVAAYRACKREKLSKQATLERVTAVIDEQVARDVYISEHLRAGAIDVRSRNMSRKTKAAFREIVAASGATLLEETRPPHFHVQLSIPTVRGADSVGGAESGGEGP